MVGNINNALNTWQAVIKHNDTNDNSQLTIIMVIINWICSM